MNQEDYRSQYERLSDDQLVSILADKQHLVAEAASALDSEVKRRGVTAEQPKWMRHSGSDKRVQSLQDYEWYQRLCKRRQFMDKYLRVLLLVPFMALGAAAALFRNHELLEMISGGLWAVWALVTVGYSLALTVRWARFKCPQCRCRFGTDAECWSCAFPRNSTR